jgi:hypothetical protein
MEDRLGEARALSDAMHAEVQLLQARVRAIRARTAAIGRLEQPGEGGDGAGVGAGGGVAAPLAPAPPVPPPNASDASDMPPMQGAEAMPSTRPDRLVYLQPNYLGHQDTTPERVRSSVGDLFSEAVAAAKAAVERRLGSPQRALPPAGSNNPGHAVQPSHPAAGSALARSSSNSSGGAGTGGSNQGGVKKRTSVQRPSLYGGVFDRNVHLRVPLLPMPARLKLLHACAQWYSSRVFTPLTG